MILDILEIKDYSIQKIGEKHIVSSDQGIGIKEWLKLKSKKVKTIRPNLSSSLVVKDKTTMSEEGSIGYFYNHKNSVKGNDQGVSILSSPFSDAHGQNIHPENLTKITSLFTARRSVVVNFTNWEDVYFKPNEEHEQFEQFKYDSLVYSLFESKSNQSSLRQVGYKNKLWDIKNEFFWMSVDEMKELADGHNYDELYQDAHADNNRYVYKLLFGEKNIYNQLSDEAKAVLDYATQLTKDSIEMRKHMANDENHLNAWDAGYAQLKLVWKEFYPERFKEFRQLYKNLEEKMRPMVYELGFLKK